MMRDEGGDWSYDGDWVTRRRGVLIWLCVAVHRELSHSALGRYAGAANAYAQHATPPLCCSPAPRSTYCRCHRLTCTTASAALPQCSSVPVA